VSTTPGADPGQSQIEASKEVVGYGMDTGRTEDLASSDNRTDNESGNGVTSGAPTPPLPLDYSETGDKKQPKKKHVRCGDPLSWYGVLVPQSLRSAQKSFTTVIEGFPELVSVVYEMRILEREIGGLRERLSCD
jgi:coiled-coil domain-containing protein 115